MPRMQPRSNLCKDGFQQRFDATGKPIVDSGLRLPRSAYLGIGLLSFVLLGSQLVLTRIFSVILWYHFAFLIVSLVMLGMAAPSGREPRTRPRPRR